MKKLFTSYCLIIMILSSMIMTPTQIFAEETQYTNEDSIETIPSEESTISDLENPLELYGRQHYYKSNVTTSYEWSPHKRVSEGISTNSVGGSISSNKKITFGTVVTGEIFGLNISTNISKSSDTGYTLNVPPNTNAYMAYRVYYRVESGYRKVFSKGKLIGANWYTVKTPQYGEYFLIKY